MALSQSIDDSPWKWGSKKTNNTDLNLQEVYNERHRLALEELLSGGVDNFLDFLRKERIPNFLSDDEIRRIRDAAVLSRCASVDQMLEQSVSSSVDCSSVTYFPDVSDVEPPVLEIGWPAFTSGSYRGVTRAVAHFQPSFGECIYSCKEAARRMIKSAKEVIAIVTDSLTDLDIFKDLQEACTCRKVPVYILLDQSCAPAFLKMCSNINVRLDDLRQMRVRTITGATYYMRSGAKVTGKVHERFMLIDGNRVATGSYRFNWTDGKLNSSNLIELSGQIAENFDEEFRILYAQSLPINTRCPPSGGISEHLLIKHPVTSSPYTIKERPLDSVCLTSTPSRKPQIPAVQLPCEPPTRETACNSSPVSNSSTIGEDWTEQQHIKEEILAGSATRCFPADAPAVVELVTPATSSCHVSTQTSWPTVDGDVQTDPESFPEHPNNQITSVSTAQDPTSSSQDEAASLSSGSCSASPRRSSPHQAVDRRPAVRRSSAPPDRNLRDSFHKLTKERHFHYTTIRTKLEHMVTMLSQRQELADVTNVTLRPGALTRHNEQRECGQRPNPRLLGDSVGMGTWPKARCVH